MEKRRDIPGWYQRLMNHQTKPASQLTFKQYCHEHETKMKILYPFLPHEQVKGKLLTRWKRHQPQNHDSCIQGGTKKMNKSKYFPVVAFPKGAAQRAALKKKSEHQFDWLKETMASKNAGKSEHQFDWLKETMASKTAGKSEHQFDWLKEIMASKTAGKSEHQFDWLKEPRAPTVAGKTAKTYKNRAFMLVPKVPTIISETPNPERSILKNKSTGAETPRERRQPTSQVSFSLNDSECLSPQLYSPPTPFALSPMLDEDQNADILPQNQDSSARPGKLAKLAVTSTIKTGEEERVQATFVKPFGNGMVPGQNTRQKRSNKVKKPVQLEESLKNVSNRKPTKGKNAKNEKIPKGNDNYNDLSDAESTNLSSQYLEPLKFITVLHESEDEKDKQFCLFEDESIRPKTPPKKAKARRGKSKSPKENWERSFSWSPALGCSQYTPKVNKSRKGLFPTEKETYHRQKQSLPSARQLAGKTQNKQHKTQARSGRKTMSQTSAKSASPKRTEKDQRKVKDAPARRNVKQQVKFDRTWSEHSSVISLPSEEESAFEEKEDIAPISLPKIAPISLPKIAPISLPKIAPISLPKIAPISLPQAKIIKGKQSRTHSKDVKEDHGALNCGKLLRSGTSPKPWTAESDISQSGHRRGGTQCRDKNRAENADTDNTPATHSLVTKQKQPLKEQQLFHGSAEKGFDCFASSPGLLSPLNSKPVSPVQQTHVHRSPRGLQGSDLLRRILFQLKDTASSSQNADQSSPARSRMTETSGMSVKSLSSNGLSPSSPRTIGDLMDDLQPASEVAAFNKAPTATISSRSMYRKRGNILCNMFDASDTDVGTTARKRYLSSESRPSESDLSILFSADIFV